jgi:Leucine-rich repeat (LRR) protein
LKKIEILDLSYTNINNLDCLSNLENLRILSLINTNISNDDFDILVNLKSLTNIDLRDNNLNRELLKKFNKFKVTIIMNQET